MSLSKALDIHIVISDIEEFSTRSFIILFAFLYGYAYVTSYKDFKPIPSSEKKKFFSSPDFMTKIFKKNTDQTAVQSAVSRMNLATATLKVKETADTPPNYWNPDFLLFDSTNNVQNDQSSSNQ